MLLLLKAHDHALEASHGRLGPGDAERHAKSTCARVQEPAQWRSDHHAADFVEPDLGDEYRRTYLEPVDENPAGAGQEVEHGHVMGVERAKAVSSGKVSVERDQAFQRRINRSLGSRRFEHFAQAM